VITEKEIIKLAKECKLHLGGENRVSIFLSKVKEIGSQEDKRKDKMFGEMLLELMESECFQLTSTVNDFVVMPNNRGDKPFGVGELYTVQYEFDTLVDAIQKVNAEE
jgi:hypothetical protein